MHGVIANGEPLHIENFRDFAEVIVYAHNANSVLCMDSAFCRYTKNAHNCGGSSETTRQTTACGCVRVHLFTRNLS